MATSSATPVALQRASDVHHQWAADLGFWARRLGSSPFDSPLLAAASRRAGALSARNLGLADWTSGIGVAFAAADRTTGPRSPASFLTITDLAARLALLRAMLQGGSHASGAELGWLLRNHGGRYLRVDPSGDGRVVEVLGDLASAKHVVVLVPGMSNDIGNYRTSLRTRAVALLSEMRSQSDEGVAVVCWLGYDTPDLERATGSTVAMVAARQLVADAAALGRARPNAHVTVVGHSYGSVVLGQAMRAGIAARTAVAVGSPGMGTHDRAALGSRRTTLWAAKATTAITVHRSLFGLPVFGVRLGDPVAMAPVHGEDPSTVGFGARRFDVGDVGGHSHYFDAGTLSLRNIARIALSRAPGRA